MPIIHNCLLCQTPFKTKNVYIKRGGGLYCSHTCWSEARHNPEFYEKRFWSNVQKCHHLPFCFYCCWPWIGNINESSGYGYIHQNHGYRKYHKVYAHRASWMIHNKKELPRNDLFYLVQHSCNTKLCVNPWHLSYNTAKKNSQDSVKDGLIITGEKHHSAKISDAQIVAIRALLKEGFTCSYVSKIFNISEGYTSDLKRNRRRKLSTCST